MTAVTEAVPVEWTPVPGMRAAWRLPFDVDQYRFAEFLARDVFKVRRLDLLHVDWLAYKRRRGWPPTLEYEDNLRLRRLMQDAPDDSLFYRTYHTFVARFVAPRFGRRISYSFHPKMRVHLAGTPGVSKWHRDADVTKREDQINVWVPFTDTFEGNTLWLENDYGSGDHRAVPVRHGEALVFDGGYLEHGTVANETDRTRVSLDFRFSVLTAPLPASARAVLGCRPG